MAKYLFSNKAVDDLSAIWDYTFKEWSEGQADQYYEVLIETCAALSKNPGIGKEYDDIENGILGFRINKHIIFYRVTKPKEILILRILHGAVDLKNRIND